MNVLMKPALRSYAYFKMRATAVAVFVLSDPRIVQMLS